jgi:hypothetical protein
MKKICLLLFATTILLSSCRILHMGRFKREKSGCPVGANIGAERILAGDPVALKAARKANKKSSGKFN